ncbi:Cof-type HAD-IIB family hydrolase [Floccifex sp.]|uniref:Cof-type HAD-IIB family hydrolase n=1 Tax=Floccifex sp. TaxID=2815810 RepID=UPI003F0EDFF2
MNISCLVFDVDGTLTNDDKKIDPRTKASIQEAMKQGIHIVISSGRSKEGCRFIYEELNLENGPHFLSLINGQQIYEFQTKQYINDRLLEKEDVFQIKEIARKYDCLSRFTIDRDAYFYGSLKSYFREIIRMIRKRKKKGSMVKGTKFKKHFLRKNKSFNKVVFFQSPSFFKEHLIQIQNDLSNYECMMVASYWMEIMPKGVNKGKALKTICQRNSIPLESVVAFGDAQNDISMLKEAGISVAMGNAFSEVKEIADYVTPSNNENGIGVFIDEKILSK